MSSQAPQGWIRAMPGRVSVSTDGGPDAELLTPKTSARSWPAEATEIAALNTPARTPAPRSSHAPVRAVRLRHRFADGQHRRKAQGRGGGGARRNAPRPP